MYVPPVFTDLFQIHFDGGAGLAGRLLRLGGLLVLQLDRMKILDLNFNFLQCRHVHWKKVLRAVYTSDRAVAIANGGRFKRHHDTKHKGLICCVKMNVTIVNVVGSMLL